MDMLTRIITEADRRNFDRACKVCGETYRAYTTNKKPVHDDLLKLLHVEARQNADALRQLMGLGGI